MKRIVVILGIVAALVAAGMLARPRLKSYWKERNRPSFSTSKVRKGEIEWTVQATGTIQPVLKVQIGSFVSGPIVELHADFNDRVEQGDLLAKVDPRLYKAAVRGDKATLARARADVLRVRAALQQSINDENRARQLLEINPGYISQSEIDQLRFAREGLEAQLDVAKLQIEQAEASLINSELNLGYTDIVAPTSGIIIDRKIDPGQTLAAQFQTPELFVLAPDMDKKMLVHASVVEADVGHVIRAKKEKRPVTFYVDAYEGELFHGEIQEVRQNPLAEQTVVTYPVVVETTNPDLKLLPGMTANLSFQIDQRQDAVLIPSDALRFLPDAQYVREQDKKILDGDVDTEEDFEPSAAARVQANLRKKTRYVWVKDKDDKLRGIEIEYGISDGKYYELVKGDLKENTELVTDVERKGRGK